MSLVLIENRDQSRNRYQMKMVTYDQPISLMLLNPIEYCPIHLNLGIYHCSMEKMNQDSIHHSVINKNKTMENK